MGWRPEEEEEEEANRKDGEGKGEEEEEAITQHQPTFSHFLAVYGIHCTLFEGDEVCLLPSPVTGCLVLL